MTRLMTMMMMPTTAARTRRQRPLRCQRAPEPLPGGRDLPGVAKFVEHKSYRRRAYIWERTPDLTRAELGRCVAQDVLADAILLRAVWVPAAATRCSKSW
jgi:hypothetical protein